MANITLYNSLSDTATYVPNKFIDDYMTTANGEYVKIYLYLLRCINQPGCNFSLSKLADHFDHTEKDIRRALKYWEKVQLLKLEYDGENHLSGICLLPSQPESTDTLPRPASSGSENTAPKTDLTADGMKAFCQREEIRELIFLTETYLGRTMNQSDLNFIFSWYDQLSFSPELIEFLVENCIAKGHSSLHYMQRVAEDWASENIKTPEEAKRLVSSNNETYYMVMKAFGIRGRNLVPSEMNLLKKWTGSYGFSREIISEACRRTIQKIHEPSFEYADSILSNWHQAGVHTIEDIKNADEAFQKSKAAKTASNRIKITGNTAKNNKFNNFQQRDYDYDQLSRKLLEKSIR
ncbi:Replication initiation/membrane attachment protein [uncultured Roseburia sp.]|uniref:DnaD domain protein n=1 Tax=Brotonthovivens ammoniilytica TaxID=2981725 RepID=A0ABT2TMD0_9FIRM|nr:DnaD domain protein [Brotonthovivens ammoniilytica]MCU6762941.1 DnaD domain protein [Brotonthovivens ammoniilytica]SCI94435.1 Replication initiation/membrane attachment protein [uncultured Roseburia sp.]